MLPFFTVPLLLPPFHNTHPSTQRRERERERGVAKMRGTSKVIMAATLVMVVSLAIVLGLILVLLAELYCSLLLRRRWLGITSPNTTSAATATTRTTTTITSIAGSDPTPAPDERSASPLSSFYAQGVLHAPRCFLFPAVSCKESNLETKKNLHSQLHQMLEVQTPDTNTSPREIGILSSSPPPTSFATSPQGVEEISIQISSSIACREKACGGGVAGEHFVYISNPIYDNDTSRRSRADTPFETPHTSPSRLEAGGSSSSSSGDVDDDEEEEICRPSSSGLHSNPTTPPLTPMKKLPAEACSVSLGDARSLDTSGSDSVSNNGLSSSSSGSPSTSPSW